MRCVCCNKNLNDWESTIKSMNTGEYLDMCRKCLDGLGIEVSRGASCPEEQPPGDENYYEFDDVEFNVINREDE